MTTTATSSYQAATFLTNGIAVEPMSSTDLLEIANHLAETNLDYLTVSSGVLLAVFTLLGTAFAFFNIRPLKETLEKQEDRLRIAEKENNEKFDKFRDDQMSIADALSLKVESKTNELSKKISKTRTELRVEVANEISLLTNVVNHTLEQNEELLLSKMDSKIESIKSLVLESESRVNEKINENQKMVTQTLDKIKSDISTLKHQTHDLEVSVKELEAEEFNRKNKVGHLSRLIELLQLAIDAESDNWRIPQRLEEIKKYASDFLIPNHYYEMLTKELAKIEGDFKYKQIIEEIKSNIEIKPDKDQPFT